MPIVEPFGPDLLIDPLDAGGMGEVWLAAPRGLGVPDGVCILKRVKSALAAADLAVKRFLDEARLGLLLRHPSIARTIDAGRVGGADYLAAELVEGIDLAKLLQRLSRRGAVVDDAVACWCVIAALDGLAAAHTAAHPLTGQPLGVVHRDISPHNLMATRDGLVRVIDFGLAVSSVREAQTEQGVIVGKLGYLAPVGGGAPRSAAWRDRLLGVLASPGGVAPAQARLRALVGDVAGAELARFDAAKRKARAAPTAPVDDPSSMATICLAISESRAVEALLRTDPPPTIELSAARIGPEEALVPSASLLAIPRPAGARDAAPTLSIPPSLPPAPSPAPVPPAPAPSTWRGRAAIAALGALAGALAVAVVLRGGDHAAPATSPPPPTPAPAATAVMPQPEQPPAPVPPNPTPAPASPAPALPSPQPAPAPASVKHGDVLLGRVRRLAKCEHACGRTFARLLQQSPDGPPPDKRGAAERMAVNCEQHCR